VRKLPQAVAYVAERAVRLSIAVRRGVCAVPPLLSAATPETYVAARNAVIMVRVLPVAMMEDIVL
jgi:hypothetical protein